MLKYHSKRQIPNKLKYIQIVFTKCYITDLNIFIPTNAKYSTQ